jgi:hypothetical protein
LTSAKRLGVRWATGRCTRRLTPSRPRAPRRRTSACWCAPNSLLLDIYSLALSDTKGYEPQIRVLLGTASRFPQTFRITMLTTASVSSAACPNEENRCMLVRPPQSFHTYLTQSVPQVVKKNSIPPQFRLLTLYISNSKG